MLSAKNNVQVVFTNRARCRDCYRCIRVCPVSAIGLRQGQAYVDSQRCISCGTCIRECPQKAKNYNKDLEQVIDLLKSRPNAAVSLAPSFASLYEDWQIKRLPSVFRRLGFGFVAETSVAAYYVAIETLRESRQHRSNTKILTSCPAIVSYIEHYKPEFIESLLPISSPMIVHSVMLKEQLGQDCKVVFIGPCVAKKGEAKERPESAVDYVLTFEELDEWFERENIDISEFEESDFDQQPQGWARNFPLAGGCLQTADLPTDMLNQKIVSVCGYSQLDDLLNSIDGKDDILIEALFCEQGCINGPAISPAKTVYQRRRNVLNYSDTPLNKTSDYKPVSGITTKFCMKASDESEITQEQIRQIFIETGKENPDDQLNCGACGYNTCKEQAIAVLRNMAEADMCVPFIRKLALQRTDKIIETSPNGIVILDEKLCILHMNPSFKKMFMCSNSGLGKNISFLMEPEIFENALTEPFDIIEKIIDHSRYNLICNQIVYGLKDENQVVGIFVNLTSNLKNKQKLDHLREQTLEQARGLLSHQISMAGQIAQYVGDSTAKSEKLLANLMKMAGSDSSEKTGIDKDDNGKWLKNIYMQK